MKTIAIIGAGEGLGFSLAQKFGMNGFQVALVARNKTKLDTIVENSYPHFDIGIDGRKFSATI